MHENSPNLQVLRDALSLACQPTGATRIVRGRDQVLALPREFVLRRIEEVAHDTLNLEDYWEYRRLLELLSLLDRELVRKFVALGINGSDPDVREAAEDYDT